MPELTVRGTRTTKPDNHETGLEAGQFSGKAGEPQIQCLVCMCSHHRHKLWSRAHAREERKETEFPSSTSIWDGTRAMGAQRGRITKTSHRRFCNHLLQTSQAQGAMQGTDTQNGCSPISRHPSLKGKCTVIHLSFMHLSTQPRSRFIQHLTNTPALVRC